MDLRIVGYQFPDIEPGQEDWDANWLVIAGSVRTAGGAAWSFRDPALTTWEAARAVSWLRGVADGAAPTAVDRGQAAADGENVSCRDQLSRAEWLTFTEPNLSFAVCGYDGQQVQLLVGLSHESAEPPTDPQQPNRCHIAVTMSGQQIQAAATELEEELAAHPAR